MTQDKVDMYLANYANYFPADRIMFIKDKLEALDDSKFAMLSCMELKDPTTMLIISIFLGGFGVDRFMIEDTGMGLLKLLTFGGCCGIIAFVDLFLIMGRTREKNFQKIMWIL